RPAGFDDNILVVAVDPRQFALVWRPDNLLAEPVHNRACAQQQQYDGNGQFVLRDYFFDLRRPLGSDFLVIGFVELDSDFVEPLVKWRGDGCGLRVGERYAVRLAADFYRIGCYNLAAYRNVVGGLELAGHGGIFGE